MAVPKVAVIALVAIIAVPILLGYAMNLEEVTVTDYEFSGDPVNVTPLLQNKNVYTYAHGNINTLNTNFCLVDPYTNPYHQYVQFSDRFTPQYEETSTNYSSLKATYHHYNTVSNAAIYLNDYNYYSVQLDYDYTLGIGQSYHVNILCDDNDGNHTISENVTQVVSVYVDYQNKRVYYTSWTNHGLYTSYVSGAPYRLVFSTSANPAPTVEVREWSNLIATDDQYVNFSAGFHFTGSYNEWNIIMPDRTKSALITLDLESVTDPNYIFEMAALGHTLKFEKTTTAGGVSWEVTADGSDTKSLYYDNTTNNNTYQIYINFEETYNDGTNQYYKDYFDLRYVGAWPTIIGDANSFITYSYELDSYETIANSYLHYVYYVKIGGGTGNTITNSPTMRVDDALFNAIEYSLIADKAYRPYYYKTNPSTTITDISRYGSSITFGGVTYTVTNGNIMLGTHKVSVNGLILDSIPSSSGTGYDNRINGNVISTTAGPSEIVFGGQWLASVSTSELSYTATHTETEWIAGSFAWDGMDQNFLMAGLITSLGVFIALGIYGRRSGARVLPLMLVCGGAALLFFIMI